MLDLTQYEYLDRDMILKGVVHWMVRESPLLQMMPQKAIKGNSYKYTVNTALPGTQWTTTGTQLSESSGTLEQRSTDIYTLIQNQRTDKGAIALNSTQDPEAVDAKQAAEAMTQQWEQTMIIGRTTTSSNDLQFKGLLRMLAELETSSTTDLDGSTSPGEGNNEQVTAVNATEGALTLPYMDALVDSIKPGKPDLLLMSRAVRRKLNVLLRASGSGVIMTEIGEYGLSVQTYDGIPVLVSDFIKNNMPDLSSSVQTISTYDYSATRTDTLNLSIIFALKLGEDATCGLHAGEMAHERDTFDADYNAITNRYIWYCGAAAHKKYGLAGLIGINHDT